MCEKKGRHTEVFLTQFRNVLKEIVCGNALSASVNMRYACHFNSLFKFFVFSYYFTMMVIIVYSNFCAKMFCHSKAVLNAHFNCFLTCKYNLGSYP